MKRAMSKKVVATVLLASMLGTTAVSAVEIKKDESVFVNLQTNGELEKITVSNWIHADESNLLIKDKSELEEIKNIKSDVQPDKNGDELTWKIDGSDLYYQGVTDKQLPIDINIKYYLDGREIKAEDLAGKSGKIKIELEVNNKIYKEVNINGKQRKIYTPFTTATVVNLPIDKFKAVKIDSGMMLSEGNNNIITFVAFPGLRESLGLDDFDISIKLSDKLTIEAEVDNFEMGPIMITATPDLPDLDDIENSKDIQDLNDKLNKLKEANEKLESKDMQEKLSLIKDDNKVLMSNKLIDDAFFAKDINTDTIKNSLSILSEDNIVQANILTGDLRAISMHKDMLEQALKLADGLSKDEDFNKLIQDAKIAKSKYDAISAETTEKLKGILAVATPENIKKGQSLINEGLSVKEDLKPINDTINGYIAKTHGNSEGEKTVNFIKGFDSSLQSASNLLSDETTNQLNGLASDMTGYASSYLIIKAQLAAVFNTVNSEKGPEAGSIAFNMKKEEFKQIVMGVYGDKGNDLITYIDSLTLSDISPEKLGRDSQKINGYKSNLPDLIKGVDSLKQMKPLIDTTHGVLSKPGEAEKLAKLLGDLNDTQTQALINSLGEGILSLNDNDLKSIGEVLNAVKDLSANINKNEENIQAIELLINQIGGNSELTGSLGKFKNDLQTSKAFISQVENTFGSIDSNDISEIKTLSGRLIDMQKDLKDSEDILRITKDALQKDNINQARNLLEALPEMQQKTNSLEDILAAKDEVVAASKEFDTFTGKSDDMDGSVKFIMKTKEVKFDVNKNEMKEETKKEKKGFFAWIKSLFTREN